MIAAAFAALAMLASPLYGLGAQEPPAPAAEVWYDVLTPPTLAAVAVLVVLSAFFSGSETAYFSLTKLRLRALREEQTLSARLVTDLMSHPGKLLTTLLVGNTIVNVMIGVFLGARVETVFHDVLDFDEPMAFLLAVLSTTGILVVFGEILPKVFAVRFAESFARAVALPLRGSETLLAVPRDGCLRFTEFLFKITRFHQLHAAPFITDGEFRAALNEVEAQKVIEPDDLEMIQGILHATDVQLREILTPRPDVICLPDTATVADALALLREREYSRVPVYHEDLDHIVGILVAKDLLPYLRKGDMDRPAKSLARPAHFVPQTMTAPQFVKEAQQHRSHIAVVVDEYGGTAGIVTLEDAMEQVVGDILDEDEHEETLYRRIDERTYIADGATPLDELSELLGVPLDDEEHETIAGFIIHRNERIPDVGDTLEHEGLLFTVAERDGQRVASVKIELLEPEAKAEAGREAAG